MKHCFISPQSAVSHTKENVKKPTGKRTENVKRPLKPANESICLDTNIVEKQSIPKGKEGGRSKTNGKETAQAIRAAALGKAAFKQISSLIRGNLGEGKARAQERATLKNTQTISFRFNLSRG